MRSMCSGRQSVTGSCDLFVPRHAQRVEKPTRLGEMLLVQRADSVQPATPALSQTTSDFKSDQPPMRATPLQAHPTCSAPWKHL